MIKWDYVCINTNEHSDALGVEQLLVSKAGGPWDTPEEAFEAMKIQYAFVWASKYYFRFFLEPIEVADEPEDDERVWKLECHFALGWDESTNFNGVYNRDEADAIINGQTFGLEYRKVRA